ncbi:MAG TPA: adenylate/guanylate cyclase domain-containing protein, partial [Chloroflexota bacterium]
MAALAEGDLRPVTVMFAAVRGFACLAEVLPPERLVQAINSVFQALDEPVARLGGEVDKFIGDTLMATFGAPVAHDDDPRRAVLAALEMQAAVRTVNQRLPVGCELDLRIGINTGLVLAGPIGSRRKRT